jgi:hypothetical protein
MQRCVSRSATNGLMHRSKQQAYSIHHISACEQCCGEESPSALTRRRLGRRPLDAFQADDEGSIPFTRMLSFRQIVTFRTSVLIRLERAK